MRRDIRWGLGASKADNLLIERNSTATGADSERLTAPVAGTVQQLQLDTIGGVVEPAKPLMVIVRRIVVKVRLSMMSSAESPSAIEEVNKMATDQQEAESNRCLTLNICVSRHLCGIAGAVLCLCFAGASGAQDNSLTSQRDMALRTLQILYSEYELSKSDVVQALTDVWVASGREGNAARWKIEKINVALAVSGALPREVILLMRNEIVDAGRLGGMSIDLCLENVEADQPTDQSTQALSILEECNPGKADIVVAATTDEDISPKLKSIAEQLFRYQTDFYQNDFATTGLLSSTQLRDQGCDYGMQFDGLGGIIGATYMLQLPAESQLWDSCISMVAVRSLGVSKVSSRNIWFYNLITVLYSDFVEPGMTKSELERSLP
ncbi:MAG: hypothetical protein JNL25_05680 [Rhodospirillaceae bacterium]|nr:hypothetical protein [Rhodospirillaceae bacterium]